MATKLWSKHLLAAVWVLLASACAGQQTSTDPLPTDDSPSLDTSTDGAAAQYCAQSNGSPKIDWTTSITYGSELPVLVVGSNFMPPTKVMIEGNILAVVSETNDEITVLPTAAILSSCSTYPCKLALSVRNHNGCKTDASITAKKVFQELDKTYSGTLPSQQLGLALANVDDIDADGYDDLAVLSTQDVRVVSGGKSPLIPQATIWQMGASDISCSLTPSNNLRLNAAGDVNNDGFTDIMVAQPFANNAAGMVCMLSGKDGKELYTLAGAASYNQFGRALARGWDVNVDGYDDFFVAAPYFGTAARGRVYLYSGFNGALLHYIDGAKDFDNFGYAMQNVGDTDGDGIDDLAVNADGYDNSAGVNVGAVWRFSGAYIFASTTANAAKIEGPAYNNFGRAISGINDLNGDGIRDLLIGAASWGGTFYTVSGSSLELMQTINNPDPTSTYDLFGATLTALGDFNGDDIEDILVGAPGAEHDAGRVYVISGADQSVLLQRQGFGDGDKLGFAISRCGDINHDGFADIAATAPFSTGGLVWEGAVYITNQSNVIGQ